MEISYMYKNFNKINTILDELVTVCKRLLLIIKRIILSFLLDIRAELYLDRYIDAYLPKRI